MRDLPGDVTDADEFDGRGLVAIPGLVDCHTHACFAGDRLDEFSLRAVGATYEQLHAAGGGILSTVRATRAAGEDGLRAALERHRGWMLRAGTTTFEAKSGYGLDHDTELAQLRAVGAAGGVPTWLGAHAVPPEFADADAYLDFALAEVLPEAAEHRRGSGRLPRARRLRRRAGPPLPRGVREAGLALRLHGDQFTEPGAIPLAIELGARSVDHLEATGAEGVARSRRATSPACCFPRARSSSTGRCLPRRALVDAGAAVALATDFNPGSAFCESLPLVCSLAATQLHLGPAEALSACTVNAAHVLGRADRMAGSRRATRADIVLLDAPDWRYLAYHLGHDHVAAVVLAGERAELG